MIEVQIEKLVYGGEGLGRIEGRAVLVPLVLPGERVAAEPVKEEPRLVRARLAEVLDPAAERIAADCPYFTRCGGCHYQHAGYENQLRYKAAILKETLARIGKLAPPEPEVIASPPWNYRNRAQLKFEKKRREPFRQATRDESFRLGYFEMGSHRLLPIQLCPISSPHINELIPQLYELGQRPDFPEERGEIEVFCDQDDSSVLITAACGAPWPETLLSAFRERIPGLVSVAVSGPQQPPRVFGRGHLTYRAAGFDYRVSHGSFFQVNRFLVEQLAPAAIEGWEGETALDLFSGGGYFALPLARKFQRVVAVESNPAGVRDLESNRQRARTANIEPVEAGAEEFLARQKNKGRPDLVLLDPPRAGLSRGLPERLAALGAPAIVYVSCDPSTLARDVARLAARGYRLTRLRMVDLFPQTFHIEAVATLQKT